MKNIKGAFPVLITPMDEFQEINWNGVKQNVNYFINQKVAGIIINGSTGEFVSLSKEERFKMVETVLKEVDGRIPVIVGTAAETTKETIEYTKHAEAHGADCALIINSYYCKPKEEEIYFHFKEISNAVNIPIMLYNNPFTSGVDMSTDLMLRIGKECENVTHIKESSGDIRKARDLVRQGEGAFQVFCGSEDLVMESYLVGATGWVSVAGNIVPGLVTKMYEHFQNGELEKAWEINDAILPLCEFLEGSGKYVQIVKRSMELHGQAGGPSRYPRLGLTEEEDQKLQMIISKIAAQAAV
ncbi:4-hydroxy-tetrahydrodipicolinate synthase [Bacillus cereus group sp. MYBK71-2]|uniref:4-hydroxy-tetrahydrodipicolinate synthase n=1 Tax=Bacillus cereus group TaxID=86661 RepID=UPI000B4B7EB8|nr:MULTISPECIES: 4-hydroxy-tetrahydrodipicolinate synthase [Bacillus cereus group]PDY91359.1 4-hydroxy-tetrahydrodipicolinate synthase [Bacillus anthracis]MCC2339998.1 4-hydroxy-tetrahydrodipicolinate synthase [Bacillus tropicus]MCU5424993.1 4-hydroxy-tetrahydrodipicolinate synthase [Bacillus tropicus]MDA1650754.1 4-hydroxy-tetrahydrodipicolinate synthase [Bacillus cereus group sp. TH160LC]MDA1778717.1 4-hydroxy-tetrahydrodipicolinate synthase [Bacillus cereus group sp. BY9-3LC]